MLKLNFILKANFELILSLCLWKWCKSSLVTNNIKIYPMWKTKFQGLLILYNFHVAQTVLTIVTHKLTSVSFFFLNPFNATLCRTHPSPLFTAPRHPSRSTNALLIKARNRDGSHRLWMPGARRFFESLILY